MVLAYSPMIDITNSSAPFLAFFGVLLSVVKKFHGFPSQSRCQKREMKRVQLTPPVTVIMVLDHAPIGPLGVEVAPLIHPWLIRVVELRATVLVIVFWFVSPHFIGCSKLTGLNAVQLTSSPAHASHSHWIHLHNTSNHSVALSFPPEWGRFLRITNILGVGSTGGVYQGTIGSKTLAVKIVEILGPEDSQSSRGSSLSSVSIHSWNLHSVQES